MTGADFELWLPVEQTYTPEPPAANEQAFTDIHGPQPKPKPRPYRGTVTVGSIDNYEPGDLL